ncbi:hypothetical protein [Leptolyngbya sp. CCY15150]|uniref:hypothetical protein n=1 Tax=Leptolyngbya sp. CCY15150 TaxID=2767772 RepID=UPI00195129EF|nr:hypothetical protein [Leptolyngbya sp. CCY15150]
MPLVYPLAHVPSLVDQWLGVYWGVLFGDLMAAGWAARRSPGRSLAHRLYQPNFLAAAPMPAWGRQSLALVHQLQTHGPIAHVDLPVDPSVDPSVDLSMDERSLAQVISYAVPLILFYHDDCSAFEQQFQSMISGLPFEPSHHGKVTAGVQDLARWMAQVLQRKGAAVDLMPEDLEPDHPMGATLAIATSAMQTITDAPALTLVRSLYHCEQRGIQDVDTYRSVGMTVGMVAGAFHGALGWPWRWYGAVEGTSDRPSSLLQLWGISSRLELEHDVQRLASAWMGAMVPQPVIDPSLAIAAAQTLQPR